jgi:trehalose 6-phosphate synthase/phosphatase
LEELESTVATQWDVDVMTGKANLEVRPKFINKGEIVKRLVHYYTSPPAEHDGSSGDSELGFVLCCGDDFTDEDMFRALNDLSGTQVAGDRVFTVSVGASNKVTLAKWHVLEPEEVIGSAALLVGGVGPSSGESAGKLSQVNLAAVSGLEGRVPT